MSGGSDLRGGDIAGADGPDWLIGDADFGKLLFGKAGDSGRELPDNHIVRFARFVLVGLFADAHNGRQSGIQSGLSFFQHVRIRFVEVLAALAMPQDTQVAPAARSISAEIS